MTNMLCESAFFGVVISLLAYELGMLLKKKFGLPIFNPLLISIAVVIVFLAVFDIDYQNYNDGAKYLSYLLTPATVCLAIPLYEQMEALKKNIKAILAGILSGVLTSLTVVLALALIFNLNHKMYVTLLPKSITTAIGMGVSEELGGGGATREDVALFKAHVAPHVKIKAAGGIADLNDARDFVALGADRLGTSRIVKAVKAMEQE